MADPTRPNTNASIIGTYGQFQAGHTESGLNYGIHAHEGIDIPAANETPVRAVMAGKIEKIFLEKYPDGPHQGKYATSSFLVIRDLATENGQWRGWNYKHVVARDNLQEGDTVKVGEVIGTIAVFPDNYVTAPMSTSTEASRTRRRPRSCSPSVIKT